MTPYRYQDALKQLTRRSEGELILETQLRQHKILFEAEYKFHPTRKWRFDFVVGEGDKRLAIEIEGGVWSKGRHTRPQGFIKDMEKYNAASEAGWRVLRFTTADVKNGTAITTICNIYGAKQ